MTRETTYWYALTFCSRLSAGKVHDLLRAWSADPKRSISNLFPAGEDAWAAAGLTPEQCEALERAQAKIAAAGKALKPIEIGGLDAVACDDSAYPPMLAATLGRSRPPLLFCAGNRELFACPAVSIIGSREPTREALEFTRQSAEAFARLGLTIVSGFAEGVDRCASAAALEAEGSTVLLLAQGLLTFGRERETLTDSIDQGRLLAASAFRPRAGWETPLAMARNAMITAMARDVVVGQARTFGGSWEAARMALNQGKRVWVFRSDHPASGHEELAALGARLAPRPSEDFEKWVTQIAIAARAPIESNRPARSWSETQVMQMLRTGSAADIHDAAGLTGRVLAQIVEGRKSVTLRTLNDLSKIKGMGPAASAAIARAFGLKPPSPQSAQISLFPEIEEFSGWEPRALVREEEYAPARHAEEPEPLEPAGEDADTDRPESEAPAVSKRRPPNLLLILASRMRADSLGCYGNAYARTPHLDALAAGGVAFERAYAATPQDAPSRASLLTGLSPRGHGLWNDGAALGETTAMLAVRLAAQGYGTAAVGKLRLEPYYADRHAFSRESLESWRKGAMDSWRGPYHGFDQVRLTLGHGPEALECGHYAKWLSEAHPRAHEAMRGDSAFARARDLPRTCVLDIEDEAQTAGWIATTAEQMLETYCCSPFFLTCSFPAPHPPFAPSRRWAEQFNPEKTPLAPAGFGELDAMPPHYAEALRLDAPGIEGMEGCLPCGRIGEAEARVILARYYAVVAETDAAIGRILARLDDLELAGETLVVFASEQGQLLGDHGLWGAGPFHYEGLVRVPFIWRMPGELPEGARRADPVSLLDFLPTALALLGSKPSTRGHGVALDRYARGAEACPRKAALVEFRSRLRPELHLQSAITRDRKMTYYPGQPWGELFDLESDPDEMENRYWKAPLTERLEMTQILLDLLAQTDGVKA